ncbi:mechanosensitive ion channel family protein [Rubrimonas cliftonensis]|nr:mechanosensitive ion channel family protein [Rubrimonas cliftonensis]
MTPSPQLLPAQAAAPSPAPPGARGAGPPRARVARRALAALAALAFLWLAGAAAGLTGAAVAQTFGDYGMVGGAPADAGPRLEDYGRLAETYPSDSALDMTQRGVSAFRARLMALAAQAPQAPGVVWRALVAASPGGNPSYFLGLLVFLVFLLGIGRAVAVLFAVYVARPAFVRMQRPTPQGLAEKLPVLATRVVFTVAGLAITLAVAVLVGAGFYPENNAAAVGTAIAVFAGYGAARIVQIVWRMTLAPYLPEYRVPRLSDRDARRLYRWLYGLALPMIVATAALEWFRLLGAPLEVVRLGRLLVEALAAVVVAAGAWANRAAIAGAILGGRAPRDATWLARIFCLLWGPALLVYLGASLAASGWRAVMGEPLGPPALAVAFAVLVAALCVYAATMFVVERIGRAPAASLRAGRVEIGDGAESERAAGLAARDPRADGGVMGGDDDEGGGPAPPPRAAPAPRGGWMRSFEDLARRVATLLALGAAIWALTWLWGGRDAFADGQPLDVAQDVIDILLIGYVAYHAMRIWIDRRIEAEGGFEVETEPGDEGGASAASRLATLLPLVRNFVLVMIMAATVLFIAMELGVNVAPLLGGAGVIGLAIGFGSQALIRDILSGAFFLIDDAFRKGEYIDVGEVKGTVEQISVRSFQLRHHLGALHTIPFGEIKHLTNFSRDWVMMKLPLRLTYDTDPEKVRKLIKKLGQQLLEHPEEGHKFMQPLKSQGVYMMEDSAMIIRVKYMTRPGDQWTTRKLVYASIRELFEREGVRFAHREVTVRIPGHEAGAPLSREEAHAAGAAARRAVDDAEAAAVTPRLVGDDR